MTKFHFDDSYNETNLDESGDEFEFNSIDFSSPNDHSQFMSSNQIAPIIMSPNTIQKNNGMKSGVLYEIN